MSKRIVIVGGGLFGALAAHLMHSRGQQVLVIDSNERYAGSKAAACLMRPSWLTKLGNTGKEGLAILDALFGLQTLKFKAGPIHVDVNWVSPSNILNIPGPVLKGQVINIHPEFLGVLVGEGKGRTLVQIAYDYLLLAAGVWTRQLLDTMPPIDALTGEANIYRGQIEQPFIDPWAPYKQIVGFNIDQARVWVGDGSAIKSANWTPERTVAVRERCEAKLPPDVVRGFMTTLRGYRPYVTGHPQGYFKQVGSRTWISTGGAKNGTVLAAAQAKMFGDAVLGPV